MSKKLSIIIPCYNEERNIPSLLNEINESFDANTFEVILIDDGSQDNTWEEIIKVSKKAKNIINKPNIAILSFISERNNIIAET